MDYENKAKKIALDFIYNEDYEESEIEKKIESLIKEKIENVDKIEVFLSPGKDKSKLRIHMNIHKIIGGIKSFFDFENEILINNNRRNILKKILKK